MQVTYSVGAGIALASAATALAFPPTVSANVADWNRGLIVPEFQLEIWAGSATTLTLAELFGGSAHPLVYADNQITTVTHGTETFTKVAHGLYTGDGPIQLTSSGTLPAGLSLLTDYWVIKTDDDNFQLATTRALALAGTATAITSNGTGNHTVVDTASTERVHWHSMGLLGHTGNGTVTLSATQGYSVRCAHYSRMIAYAVSATISGSVATNIRIYPVTER